MRARRSIALALTSWLAVSILTPGDAAAQDAAAAEALFAEGKQLAAESRWSEACPKFEASWTADPSVGTLLNWADCLEKEGRLASAQARFQQAEEQLRAAGDPRATIAAERSAALEPRAPRLLLRSTSTVPAGVTVHLDGAPIALDGVSGGGVERRVDPGPRTVEARRGDRVLETWEVAAREGESTELTVDLAAVDRAAPAPTVAPPVARTPAEPPSQAPRVAGWILVGTGGVALVTSGVLGLAALGEQADAEDTGGCFETACSPRGVASTGTAGDLAEAAQWIGLGGVGLLAVGVTLVLTAPTSDEAPTTSAVRVVAAPGRLLVDGSF